MGKREKKSSEERVGFGTLMLWQSRSVSITVVVLLQGFLMIYCTNTLMLPPILVSGLLVASKLIDGVTDMVAGFIVDKTKTKWGKARPYEIFIIFLWLCTWLMFSCPEGWSTTVKIIWVFAMYVLVNAICITFLNANGTPYIVRAFKDKQIIKLTSLGSVVTMLAGLIFNITFPTLMGAMATSGAGWSRMVGMLAIPLAAIGILRMIFIKEKYDVDVVADNKEQLKIKDVLTVLKVNKYILLFAVMNLIFNFVTNMGIGQYYYTYIVGNIGLMGLTSAINIIVIPLAFIFPKLISKFSTEKLIMAGFFISAAGYLVNFFAGANVPILMVGVLLTGMGVVPASMLLGLIIIDCADYNEWKGIHRMEGTMSSITGLGSKIGAALGSASLGVLLQISGFKEKMEVMPDSAYMMIKLLMSLIPMVLYIITGLSIWSSKLSSLMPKIKEENKARRDMMTAKTGNEGE